MVGFDITSSHFTHPAFLPGNVELRTWDAWSPVPEEYIGAFDVVHLRLLVSAVVDNNARPLIDNALAMLRPGGYLQWDENDPANQEYHVPEKGMEAPGARALTTLMRVMTKAHSRILPDWLYGLAQTLREKGCDVLVEGKMEAKRELAKAWTENYLLVFKGMCCRLVLFLCLCKDHWTSLTLLISDLIPTMPETPAPLPPGMGLPESLSRQSFAELVKQTIDEAAKGVSLDSPYYVTVARKSE